MDSQDQKNPLPETQQEFFSQATYQQPSQTPDGSEKKRRLDTRAIRSKISQSFAQTVQNFFYQTTMTEKVVIVSSILVIVFTLTKWGAIEKETVTGISNLVYFIGWLLIASALLSIGSLVWFLAGKSFPKSFPSLPVIQMILGIEIVQLAIIGYTVLTAFKTTISFNAEDVTLSPALIVLFGILIFASGLFEERIHQKKSNPTKLPSNMYARPEEHDLDRILSE
ncbi:MAG: hypothetical protein ACK4NC_02480 [Candidatus Gracilibacteria bacterium]